MYRTEPLVDDTGETVGEVEILPDPGGPPGNQGVIRCAVCLCLGWYMDANERGHRIIHPGRPWACRAPL
jgi:hypothetical protein